MADQYVYSPIDFCADCYNAGFRVGKGLATIIAISGAETAGTYDPKITNTAGNTPPSTDRGIVQINSYWHPEVSDACAFDPGCSAVQAFRISSQGTNFAPWATYNNGAYKRYLQIAWMAIDAFQRMQKLNADKDALNQQISNLNQTVSGLTQQVTQIQADSQTQINSLNAQIAKLTQQISQLQSADQQTVIQLQQQLTDVTAMRDAAVARAETAEGKVTQLVTNINAYINSTRGQLLG